MYYRQLMFNGTHISFNEVIDKMEGDEFDFENQKQYEIIKDAIKVKDTFDTEEFSILNSNKNVEVANEANRLFLIENYTVLNKFNRHIRSIHPVIEGTNLTIQFALLSKMYSSPKKAEKILLRLIKLAVRQESIPYIENIIKHNKDDFEVYRIKSSSIMNSIKSNDITLGISGNSNIKLVPSLNILNSIYGELFHKSFVSFDEKSLEIAREKRKYKLDTRSSRIAKGGILSNYKQTIDIDRSSLMLKLITRMPFNFMDDILSSIDRQNIDLHDFIQNLSHRIYDRMDDDKNYHKEVYNFIKRTYKSADFFKYIQYINYSKVRNADNLKNAMLHIHKVENAKNSLTYSNEIESEMFINIKGNNEEIYHTKAEGEISTIGNRTNCCFHAGGAARSLLKPAIESPIAGIITGKLNYSTWFSFVWEIVEYNPERRVFEVNLILDNIEAVKQLDFDSWVMLYKWLENNTNYKKIYLGTVRNDVAYNIFKSRDPIDESEYLRAYPEKAKYRISSSSKLRPQQLINYESNFTRYGTFDDSKNIHTVMENDNNIIKNVKVEIMTRGWQSRIKYMEKYIWADNHDNDFMKIKPNNSPSYVIYNSDDNSLLGYMITRIIKYDVKNDKLLFDYKFKSNITEDTDNYKDVLYIEDIYLPSNSFIGKAMAMVIDNLSSFVKENNIEYSSASTISYSSPFRKRLEKYTKYVEDNRFLNKIVSHTILDLERSIPSKFISKDIIITNNFEDVSNKIKTIGLPLTKIYTHQMNKDGSIISKLSDTETN